MTTQVCTLLLDNLPPFDPALFGAFWSLTTIRGLLSVTGNLNLYTLGFLSNVTTVAMLMMPPLHSPHCSWTRW